MSDCQICISPFNKSTKQTISCCKCNETCCLSCIKTFLGSSNSDPTCMFCNEALSKYDLIKMKLPKSYLEKEYKMIRQNVLFNNDKSHFHISSTYVPQYVELSGKYKSTLNLINISQKNVNLIDENEENKKIIELNIKKFNELSNTLVDSGSDVHMVLKKLQHLSKNREMIEYKKHKELLVIHKVKLNGFQNDIRKLHDRIKRGSGGVKNGPKGLTLFCQENSCNGMLDENSNCITCKKSYCTKCNTNFEEGHSCKDDDVLTYNMIKNQTKSCPKCSIPIYKIHGCDQMFCVSCHTPFSWKTGRVINDTGFFHNPHYFQHLDNGGSRILADTNRNQNVPISWGDLSNKLKVLPGYMVNDVRELYRRLLELIDIKLNHFREEPSKSVERVKFLSNVLTEQEYKHFLSREDKKREFLYNIDKIYEVFYHKMFDLLKTFQPYTDYCFRDFKTNIQTISNDCLICIKNICDDFGSKSKQHRLVIIYCIPNQIVHPNQLN